MIDYAFLLITALFLFGCDQGNLRSVGKDPNSNTQLLLASDPLSSEIEQNTPGDANGDHCVDFLDYQIWADHFLQKVPGAQNGNFNLDDIVDGADYTVWSDNFGNCKQ